MHANVNIRARSNLYWSDFMTSSLLYSSDFTSKFSLKLLKTLRLFYIKFTSIQIGCKQIREKNLSTTKPKNKLVLMLLIHFLSVFRIHLILMRIRIRDPQWKKYIQVISLRFIELF